MHAYGTQPSLVKRLCDIYMMVWPGWGATNTSGRESTRGLYALKQKYHLPSKRAVFCAIFFTKKVFLLSKKFFFQKFFKNLFLLSFTSNLLSFTTFYSVLPRLVLSFTKYPSRRPPALNCELLEIEPHPPTATGQSPTVECERTNGKLCAHAASHCSFFLRHCGSTSRDCYRFGQLPCVRAQHGSV